jgi:hypothetical protein
MKKIIMLFSFLLIFLSAYSQKKPSDTLKIDWKIFHSDTLNSIWQKCNDGDMASCSAYIKLLKHWEDSSKIDEARTIAFWEDKSLLLNQVANAEIHFGKGSPQYDSAKKRYENMPKDYTHEGGAFYCPTCPVIVYLTSISVCFITTGDDKDWNTQVDAQVMQRNHLVAQLICCSGGNPSTRFDRGHNTGALKMVLYELVKKEDLGSTCTFVINTIPVGNDNWEFNAYVHATFSDGTTRDWPLLGIAMNAMHSHLCAQNFPLN